QRPRTSVGTPNNHLNCLDRLPARKLVGRDEPSSAELGGRLTAVEIADVTRFRTRRHRKRAPGSRRRRLYQLAAERIAIDLQTALPHALDRSRGENVRRRVAVHEHEVCAKPWR